MKADDRLRGLYAVTRGNYRDTEQMMREVDAALRGGVSVLQYRDKSDNMTLRQEQASTLAALCQHYGALLIINDDLELARYCAADGVHLGRDDSDITTALEYLGPDKIIGMSCYNQLDAARHAAATGASYVAFGSFYPSPTKPKAVRAPKWLLEQWKHPRTPACAIGGITLRNAAPLVRAGASMVAVISDLWSADDIYQRAKDYQQLWDDYAPVGPSGK